MTDVKIKKAVIREDLLSITNDYRKAIILNQFIYWSERVSDADKFIQKENEIAKNNGEEERELFYGWIYKTAEELADEVMLGLSASQIRRYISELVDMGYISKRNNPKYKWDKTYQYRVNLYKIQLDLGKMGYVLEGYKLLPNIKIVEETETVEKVEDIAEDIKENENKEAPTFAEVEAEENLENLIDNNIIPQKEGNNASDFMEDDIETKNKKLMEQEKRFIPSFDMRWN